MLRPIQPYIEYAFNQDYIIEFLCVNKEKPKLHCNGKCYLAKQIEKQQDSEPKSLKVLLDNYPIGFVDIVKINPFLTLSLKKQGSIFLKSFYFYNYTRANFDPPEIV